MFVLVPVAAAALRASLGVVLLPVLLVGFGDRTDEGASEIRHLASPGCWLALAPCSLAEKPLVALPMAQSPAASSTPYTVEPEPFLPVPSDLTPRHVWFGLWLLWFVWFLLRRRRKRRAA